MDDPPPPPPPPHGQNPRPPGGGLPQGNYDIFIIPPHSAGGGFLYLPSMQPHRNSFLLGVACTLLAVGVWTLVMPVLKQWTTQLVASGGVGVLLLVIGVGVAGWAWGKTQVESEHSGPGQGGAGQESKQGYGYEQQGKSWAPPPPGPEPQPGPQASYPPPPPPPPPPRSEPDPPPPPKPEPPPPPKSEPEPKPAPKPAAASGWEKAREETRKREEERKRAEELRKKREEAQKLREEAEKAAKAKAEKEKWEQARAREKEQREREARERIARERLAREKEAREKDTKEREAKERFERQKEEVKARAAAAAAAAPKTPSPPKSATATPKSTASNRHERSAAATSYLGSESGYRPYDEPSSRPKYKSSGSSISGYSESSYAPSASTARTTPPPSHHGPYSTTDPDKIQIKAVYLFSDSFPQKPLAQLIANEGSVTDGLILRIKTEGLFIDDDVRGVPQREWDVKAWTLKHIEEGDVAGFKVVRFTTRDAENKKFTFVLEAGKEGGKVTMGLQRLRKGPQVRALGMNGMKAAELNSLLGGLGWL
ncbi:hypothetical protein KC367_g6839 [Hortaea werneckii]|nr:hypothetical protein KC367_g6839 [Hortaea werneckii]